MTEKRRYTLKERAKSQAGTRQRIVEATMALHEEVGPRNTTISAIAARAGLQRLTVYRHFPDETAVFQACTSHWLSLNPPPGPEDWESEADPAARRATQPSTRIIRGRGRCGERHIVTSLTCRLSRRRWRSSRNM